MAGKPTGNDALALDIRDVSFEYAEGRAGAGVYGISLQLEPGQVALLTGASGCGKTTVTRLANGLVPHYYEGTLSGRAQVAGVDVSAAPLYETARVAGSVFQNPKTQFFSVDVRGEVAFGCENLGLPVEDIEARVAAQAKAFNLEDLMGRSLFDLSGGQKQRIACAAATAASPALVVMDEPSSNLDFEGIVRLREAIRHWKAQGRAVLVAEHRLHYVADIADLVLYMERGRIARRWTGAEFAALPADALCDLGLRVRRVQDAFAAMGAASASPAAEPSEAEAPAAPTASSSEAEVQTAPAISPSESEAPAVPTAATSQASAKALAIDDFRFAYRRGANATLALDIEHAELPQGGIVAVVGRNGAGKSTFAEALCGLNRCGGRLTVGGRAHGRKQRTRASFMVMQDVNHQLFAESVLDEVQLSLAEEDEASAHELLRALDLDDVADDHPLSLSGGQRQRVCVAAALASKKPLVVYDEPTSGLDLAHMRQVAALLRQVRDTGATQVVVTHDPEFILSCCSQVLEMESGRIMESYALDAAGMRRLEAFFARAQAVGGESWEKRPM